MPEDKKVTAGQLAFDDNYQRKQNAPDGSPTVNDITEHLDGPTTGRTLDDMLPRRRHPDREPTELEPPQFLQPLEKMIDIYMRVKARMTRRTKEILEGPDLEDLISMMHKLFDDEALVRKSDALPPARPPRRHRQGQSPAIGFSDPRLTELWRLFLEGWDLWVPEGKESGVDLFWEGEGEDDDGNVIEILQSLQFREGEALLHPKVGELEDKITFDGQAFYRLKTEL